MGIPPKPNPRAFVILDRRSTPLVIPEPDARACRVRRRIEDILEAARLERMAEADMIDLYPEGV